MKKLLFFLCFLLISFPVMAASTWYIRSDGGTYGTTTTTCNGMTNVGFVSGQGPNCAVKSIYQIHNYTTDDGSGVGGTERISGGDTVIFSKPGDQFPIGADRTTTPSGCSSSFPYGCYLKPFPSGPDAAHPTRIVGVGWDGGCPSKVQLYGTQGTRRIFELSGKSHIDVECLELTDHSSCALRLGSIQCAENYPADVGAYGRVGIYATSGTDFTFKNLDIHGMAERGFTLSQLTGATFQNVNIDGNPQAGLDGDIGGTTNWSGTFTVDHTKTRFNGCYEVYPRSASFNIVDYPKCFGTGDGGYGDGWGFNESSGSANFNITNSEWSHNSSDGLDLLYHANGNIKIDKSLFEGNDGQQLKISGQTVEVTNSIIIGNCKYLLNAGKGYNNSNIEACRAGGDAIDITPVQGSSFKWTNNTIIGSPNSVINVTNRYHTANGSETYAYSNNIYKYDGIETKALYLNTDPDGLTGSAKTAWDASTTNHSEIYGINNNPCPSGTGNLCNSNPNFGGTYSSTAGTNVPAVVLQSSSPGKGTGTTNTYWNDSKDYNSNPQNSPIDMGALRYGSSSSGPVCGNGQIEGNEVCDGPSALNNQTCATKGFQNTAGLACAANCLSFNTSGCTAFVANGGACSTGGNCSSNTCCSSVCSATACPLANGAFCAADAACASTHCCGGMCQAAVCPVNNGGACSVGGNCASGNCCNSICQAGTCPVANGGACTIDQNCSSSHCCSGLCQAGACLVANGGACLLNTNCSSSHCCNNLCQSGACLKADNQPCAQDGECSSTHCCSGFCLAGTCPAPISGYTIFAGLDCRWQCVPNS